MKKNIHYSSIILAICSLLALLYSGFALADVFPIPKTDISAGYLVKIFGETGGFADRGMTLLGVVFRDFNYGVMTIAPLFLAYTTGKTIVDTASDGQSMGKKLSPWIIMRTAIGFAILIPKMTGYSMLQASAMWIVLQGVGLADLMWQDVLDYLKTGGVIYEGVSNATSKAIAIDGDLVTGGTASSGATSSDGNLDAYAGSMSLLRAQVCMAVLTDAIQQEQKYTKDYISLPSSEIKALSKEEMAYAKSFSNASINLYSQINPTEGSITFPGEDSLSYQGFDLKDFSGICGKFRWAWDVNPSGYTSEGSTEYSGQYNFNDKEYMRIKQMGIDGMVTSFIKPLSRTILNKADIFSYNYKDYDKFSNLNREARNVLVDQAASTYLATISQIRDAKGMKYKSRDELDKESKRFYKDAYEKGWASAGEYYYALTKVQQKSRDLLFYRIWTANETGAGDIVETKGVGLTPAPRFKQASGIITPNTTLQALYEKFTKHYDPTHTWSKTFLQNKLEPILNWTSDVNDMGIQPYLADLNTIYEQSGAGLNLDDDEQFKKFLGVLKDAEKQSIMKSGKANVLRGITDTLSSLTSKLSTGSGIKTSTDLFATSVSGSALDVSKQLNEITDSISGIADSIAGVDNVVRKPLYECVSTITDSWISLMTGSSSAMAPVQKLSLLGSVMLDSVSKCWHDISVNLTSAFEEAMTVGTIVNTVQAVYSSTLQIVAGTISTIGDVVGWLFMLVPGAQKLITMVTSFIGSLIVSIGEFIGKELMVVVETVWKAMLFNTLSAMPLALGITGMMFSLGVILYFYIPFLPYMIFTLGVLSWLIFVIEAMAAAAIVTLGLLDPKATGDELWGRAEPAQMLWLSVFIRPATMIIGLITGTVLSFVGVLIINTTFLGFVNTFPLSVAVNGPADALSSFKNIGLMFVYTFIMISIITKSYECITSIPEQILRWLSMQTKPSSDMQLVQEMKQGMSQIASDTGATAKATAEKQGQDVERAQQIQGGGEVPGVKIPSIKDIEAVTEQMEGELKKKAEDAAGGGDGGEDE